MDLCRAVKGDFETSHIPVVMLSAKSTMDDMLHGLMCGGCPTSRSLSRCRISSYGSTKAAGGRERLRQRYQRNLTVNVDQNDPGCSAEDIFIRGRLTRLILDHIFGGRTERRNLCRELNISRSSLHRKLKAVANLSAGEFIRNVRHAAGGPGVGRDGQDDLGDQLRQRIQHALLFQHLFYDLFRGLSESISSQQSPQKFMKRILSLLFLAVASTAYAAAPYGDSHLLNAGWQFALCGRSIRSACPTQRIGSR